MNRFLMATPKCAKDASEFVPNQNKLQKLASFFQMFSDSTRLKIISCLSLGSFCVSDLSKLLDINQTTLSHQLHTLKSQSIISATRNGKLVVYSLSSPLVDQTMLSAVNFLSQAD